MRRIISDRSLWDEGHIKIKSEERIHEKEDHLESAQEVELPEVLSFLIKLKSSKRRSLFI